MKLMFASDIHGSLPATERVLELFAQSGAQWLVILGDVLNHGPRNALPEGYAPAKVAERLNEVAHKVIAVRGNCDSEVDQMLLEFPIMADFSTLFADGWKFFLTHGHHWNPAVPPPVGKGTVLAYGHTHLPQLEKLENGLFAFNPGSISLPKGGNPASFGWFDGGVLQVLELENGREMMRLDLRA